MCLALWAAPAVCTWSPPQPSALGPEPCAIPVPHAPNRRLGFVPGVSAGITVPAPQALTTHLTVTPAPCRESLLYSIKDPSSKRG